MIVSPDHLARLRAVRPSLARWNWFGVELGGEFAAGTRLTGRIAPTKVDSEVGRLQQPYAGLPCEWHVERVDPCVSSRFAGILWVASLYLPRSIDGLLTSTSHAGYPPAGR